MTAEEANDQLAKLPDEPVRPGGMVPTRAEHNWLLMQVRQAHRAGLCPSGETPEQTYLKLHRGRELGIPLATALAQLYVVNGRVATMGRLKLALVRKSGRYQFRFEPVDDKRREAKFTIWPKGCPEEAYTAHWTIDDAKERGIVKSAWGKYPDYMLRWRAVSEAVDLVAPDACDLPLVEELVADFDLRGSGEDVQLTITQEAENVLPRVVSAEETPLPNESGYVMPAEWRTKAESLMHFLDYPPPEIEATLAALTSDDDAKALGKRLQAERETLTDFDGQAADRAGEPGETGRLFGDGDE